MRLVHRLVPGLVAGALLVGGVSPTLAAKNSAAHAGFAYGQVSNLTSSGFTLTFTPRSAGTAAQVFTVTVTTTSRERALNRTAGPLASGDYALVFGQKTGTAISATRIWYSAKPFNAVHRVGAFRRSAVGTVNLAGTNANQLSITTRRGRTLTFSIRKTTTFRVNKQIVTAPPTFTQGERVRVVFKRDAATKMLVALRVAVLPAVQSAA